MNWLLEDWHELLSTPWSSIALALMAVLCGVIVGAEREKREKPAGLRTMALVSLGAAVFTMISFAIAGEEAERGRIAAQIVTGVGFLGAGAILRGSGGVRGMTTAATIWATAATGMLVGAGFAAAGLGLSVMILGVLTGAAALEKRYFGRCKLVNGILVFDSAGGKARVKIEDILADYRIAPAARQEERMEDDLTRLRFKYCNAHKHHKEFLTQLAGLPEVRQIHHEEIAGP